MLFKSMTFKSKWMMLHNFVVPIWNSKPLAVARWQQANNLICFLVSLWLSLLWKPAIYQLASFKMRAPKRMCSLFSPLRKVTPIQESLEAEHSGPLRIMSGMTDEWRISWVKNREADLRSRSCNQKKKLLWPVPPGNATFIIQLWQKVVARLVFMLVAIFQLDRAALVFSWR